MENNRRHNKREYIIDKCYECYVRNGIENTTTRDFCAAADVNANTLYYYFDSKSGILFCCVDYGYRQLESAFFEALKEFDKSSFDVFPRLAKIGLDFAPQMRFLNQAVSSPSFAEHREEQFIKVNAFYERLGRELATRFECPYGLIEGYIREIMTLLSYFTLWGSRDMAAIQFNRIFIDFRADIISYRQMSSTP